ncbi:porin [Pelomonas aquatica]|jgi:predicted porin|uniref:Porin n=1 Tax=Pelomonas aquatica TaxID=431058 RepID=A0A9X4R793_9BURK|nr:porin [Pelomonas aquatica]MCY4754818.1 porin [Pelomonas aquatica]MDG0861868.1 porin [Pelomonas aquatica]
MKKPQATLATLCLSALFSAAQAEPYLFKQLSKYPEYSGAAGDNKFSLYGSVDAGLNLTQTEHAASLKKEQSGGAYTSKFGIYGREDLGSGLRAEFNLEAGLQTDTGTANASQFWDRAAWVGLKSRDYGTLRLGNQLGVSLPLFVDPFGVVSTNSMTYWLASAIVQKSAVTPGLSATSPVGTNSDLGNGASQVTTRVPRAISYTSPRVAGVDLKLLYAPGANTASYNRTYNKGVVTTLIHGPWYGAASYNQVFGVDTSTMSAVRTDVSGLAGIYDAGDLVLSAAVNRSQLKTATGGRADVYSLGMILPQERHIWRLSLVYRDTRGVRSNVTKQEVESSALGWMAGYDYEFSRSVGLYARAGVLRNFGASTVVLNNATLPLLPASSNAQPGIEARTASLGMFVHF